MAENYTDTGVEEALSPELDYHALNAQLNLYDADGRIQFDADRKAARQYFLQHVNQNTVFFHDLEEKLKYLVDEGYYEKHVLDQYDFADIKELYKQAYAHKFRFPTFLGAFKYYTSYTLKTSTGSATWSASRIAWPWCPCTWRAATLSWLAPSSMRS